MILEKRLQKELSSYFEKNSFTNEEKIYILEQLNEFANNLDDQKMIQFLPKNNVIYKIISKTLGISNHSQKTLNNTMNAVNFKMSKNKPIFENVFKNLLNNKRSDRKYNDFISKLGPNFKNYKKIGRIYSEDDQGNKYNRDIYLSGDGALGLNIDKNSNLRSISQWNDLKMNDEGNFISPSKELLITKDDIDEIIPKISNVLSGKQRLPEDDVEMKFVPDGSYKTYQEQNEENSRIFQNSLEGIYDDTSVAFDDVESDIALVDTGKINSLILSGNSITNKRELLNKKNKLSNFKHVSGANTPMSLYRTLYDNKDKHIVIDDLDEIMNDQDIIDILKPALNYDNRTIVAKMKNDMIDNNIPDKFDFQGKILLLSNNPADSFDSRLTSASRIFDVESKSPNPLSGLNRIKNKIKVINYPGSQDISNEIKSDVLYWLENNYKGNITPRLFVTCCLLVEQNKDQEIDDILSSIL